MKFTRANIRDDKYGRFFCEWYGTYYASILRNKENWLSVYKELLLWKAIDY